MTQGRRPMAQEVLERRGSFDANPRRRNELAPKMPKGKPPMPEVVRSNVMAAAKWEQVCELLDEAGILAKSDVDLLESYCITYAMYRQALVNVNKTGQVLVRKTKNGTDAVRSPFSVELHKYMDRLNRLLPELGLTPSSRTRLQVLDGHVDGDPFSDIIAKMSRN